MKDKLRKVKVSPEVQELLGKLSQEGEVWMPHPKYTEFYGSNQGRIASVHHNRAKCLKIGTKVELTRGTRGANYMRKQFLPHRFLWECFYGLITDTRQIVFKDGDKTNRALDNLMLVEPSTRIKITGTRG
jgi:hypothetical protein